MFSVNLEFFSIAVFQLVILFLTVRFFIFWLKKRISRVKHIEIFLISSHQFGLISSAHNFA